MLRRLSTGACSHTPPPDGPIGSAFFERETDLQGHLVVVHVPIFDIPACPDDLEPAEMSEGLRGAGDGALDCILDASLRGSSNIDNFVNMIVFFHLDVS